MIGSGDRAAGDGEASMGNERRLIAPIAVTVVDVTGSFHAQG